jgi:hypothetical protein
VIQVSVLAATNEAIAAEDVTALNKVVAAPSGGGIVGPTFLSEDRVPRFLYALGVRCVESLVS